MKSQDELNQHDPIAYITGSMTQLNNGEITALQLLLTPKRRLRTKTISTKDIDREVAHSKSRLQLKPKQLQRLLNLVLRSIKRTFKVMLIMILDIPENTNRRTAATHTHTNAVTVDEELAALTREKMNQPLFQAQIRVLVSAADPSNLKQRVRALEASLASFDYQGAQALRLKPSLLTALHAKSALLNAQKRLPSLWPRSANLLSAGEIADLYHFPYGAEAQVENSAVSLSRSLPAPISLKQRPKLDVLLGTNRHNGDKTPIGLTEKERERHVYIVGGTGNGKTTMLLYGIEQDIKNNKGLAVIDPHGDLAETVLSYIPKKRLGDVIYFNPDDVAYPLGMNLLELPEGLSEDEYIREKDLVTETVISVFRKIFSEDDSGGHRIEYVLRNTIQTALTLPGSTLFTIFRLLTNDAYRRQVVGELNDQDLKDFWNNEMGKAGEFQRIKMSAGITAKVGRFLFSASAKRVLGQPESTIDFDDIINSGKILICNFSKGLLGEDTASLFGITTLAKLQIATLRRARLTPDQRRPFYLYVDEFQNFATMSFVQMMSEARKYKLILTMAEQSTAQQAEKRIVNIILANAGTVVCFRSASPEDEENLLPLFSPFVSQSDLTYLPPFQFFIRIASLKPEAPFSGETVVLNKLGIMARIEQVLESSRSKYAIKQPRPTRLLAQPTLDIDDYEIDAPFAVS